MVNIHKIYVSIDGQPEFNPCDNIEKFSYLGTESSPILTNNYQDSNSTDGSNFGFAQFGKNIINVHFKLHVIDRYDYESKRHKIYGLFVQKKIFRLRFEENLNMVVFVRPVGFDITPFERAGHDCDIIIPFENPTGYKFSRYDSLNQVDLWDDFPLGFDWPVMTKNDFQIKDKSFFKLLNPSGIPIDPYEENHKLKIILSWNGPKITLTNLENDSTYSYFGDNDGNIEIVLDGVETFKRDQQVNSNTDFGNIKLEPGFNRFRVDGTNQFEIKFDFPFLYV